MTTLPNMGLSLPVRGAPGAGLWGDTLDANTQLTDAHDHTTGKGTAITSAALNINADVSWSSLYAPTNLHRVQFASVPALSSNAQNKSIFVSDGTGGLTANELYWRNNTGNHVKMTSGNALNFAAFVGGIGGDYTAVGAALNFDDSQKRYTMKDGSSGWARIASGEIRLIETGTTEAVFVGHQAPSALALSYTVTWPLAVPGSTAIMQMDSAGVLTASNTVSQAATFSGLITASAGVTAAANQNFTASGTGDFKHGTRTLQLSAIGAVILSGSATRVNDGSITSTASATLGWELPLKTGDRVTSLTITGFGDGAIDPQINLQRTTNGTTSNYAGVTITNAPSSFVDTTITPGSPSALGTNDNLFLLVLCNAGSFNVSNIRVAFDRP